jgi:hypothetical protein
MEMFGFGQFNNKDLPNEQAGLLQQNLVFKKCR